VLTDTTFWIDLLEERRDRQAGKRRKMEPAHAFIAMHRAHRFHVSIITWGELAEGFTEYDHLDYFLRGVHILPLPRQVVWTGSRIQRDLAGAGLRLGENDAWIAATALAWGKRLITRDKRFDDVKRLKVLKY
jgi:predicted nucleic acid-binding protein